nr:MAG TPA: hypothetical protein [Caudoviricetes sp.]
MLHNGRHPELSYSVTNDRFSSFPGGPGLSSTAHQCDSQGLECGSCAVLFGFLRLGKLEWGSRPSQRVFPLLPVSAQNTFRIPG